MEKDKEFQPDTQKNIVHDADAKNMRLAAHTAKLLANDLAEPLAKMGRKGIRFRFYRNGEPYDKTGNVVTLEIMKDNNGEVVFHAGVSREGNDRIYSNFLFEAGKTQDEIRAWLQDTDANVPVILNYAQKLLESIEGE